MKISLALDATQISEYLTCPQLWYYRYHECLGKVDEKREALDKGTLIHALCDIYYKLRAMNPKETYDRHVSAAVELIRKNKVAEELGFKEKDIEFLINRFIAYTLYWYNNSGDFKVPMRNGLAAVELGFSVPILDDNEYLFVIEGRIDLIAELSEKLHWVDHKTQSRFANLYIQKPQFLTYALASGLDGIVNYIGLQQTVNGDTFRRSQIIHIPEWKLREWKNYIIDNVFMQIAFAYKYNIEFNGNYKFKRSWNSCSGSFDSNPCMFTPLCETNDERLRENIEKFQFVKVAKWEPWKI